MLTGKKILVIDDDQRIRQLLERILKREGGQVECVATGQAGVARVQTAPPDLVLLDVVMAEMDGIEVCHHIRTFSDVPILFLSAIGDEQATSQALRCGDGYLVKPFARQYLLMRIQALLAG